MSLLGSDICGKMYSFIVYNNNAICYYYTTRIQFVQVKKQLNKIEG